MQLFQQACTKNNESANYAYRLELEFTPAKDKNPTRLEGCGFFVPDPQLHGSFQIVEVHGNPVNNNNAVINIDAYSQKINGNNTCNQINGSFIFGFESLHFGKVQTTLMACQDAPYESLVNEVFSKGRVGYEFTNLLVFLDGDKKIMVLKPLNDR